MTSVVEYAADSVHRKEPLLKLVPHVDEAEEGPVNCPADISACGEFPDGPIMAFGRRRCSAFSLRTLLPAFHTWACRCCTITSGTPKRSYKIDLRPLYLSLS